MGKDLSVMYNSLFFDAIRGNTQYDGEEILPAVIEWIKPKSVIDFGCGEGIWLSIIKSIDERIKITGVDGDYVNAANLKIEKDCFYATDLRRPLDNLSTYDMAISTEVGEHLDAKYADIFVDNIVKTSENIFFTAAIPGQGGTDHVNEQWQDYWIDKFQKRGYYFDPSVRDYFWTNKKISPWRRQNIMFFSKKELSHAPAKTIKNVVHPELFARGYADDLLSFCISSPETFEHIDTAVQQVIRLSDQIVIYPFGRYGKLAKKILNIKYGIRELAIADNIEWQHRRGVVPASALANLNEGAVILDTCGNLDIHGELLNELYRYVDKKNIFSIFDTRVKV